MSENNPLQPFVAADAFEAAIHAGDTEAVLAMLAAETPTQRAARRASLERIAQYMKQSHWGAQEYQRLWQQGRPATQAQYRALQSAIVACADPEALYESVWMVCVLGPQDLEALCHRFGLDETNWRTGLERLAQAALRQNPNFSVRYVHTLVAAGLIERPASDEYIISLIALPRALWQEGALDAVFARDPSLYTVMLRFFEVEGTGENNLAALDKYSKSKQTEWSTLFQRGIEAGIYTRAQLLERTLDTLQRDWPQFRAGWFSRFHDTLAPSVEEMAPLAERYLALCASRIPPTVSLALAALKVLQAQQCVDGSALLAALQPVFFASAKSQVAAALALADAAVKREPALAHEAAALALNGLVHEAADLQKKILDKLKLWGLDAAAREALAAHTQSVAATNRPALAALLGAAPAVAETRMEARADAEVPARGPLDPLDPSRKLAPIARDDELVERIAYVLENENEIDELERVLQALVQRAPLSAELIAQCAPVLKRARKLSLRSVAGRFARLLVFVCTNQRLPDQAERRGVRDPSRPEIDELLTLRIDALMAQSEQGWGLPPLSSATHQRGFIDPAVLIERITAYQARGVMPELGEQVRAVLRLPGLPILGETRAAALLAAAQTLGDAPLLRALRHALGAQALAMTASSQDECALFAAAARIRHPGGDDAQVRAVFGDIGPDGAIAARYAWRVTRRESQYEPGGKTYVFHNLRLSVPQVAAETARALIAVRCVGMGPGLDEPLLRYAATVLPAGLETFFAEGCNEVGNNLDWWEADWHNRAFLTLLLDPTVPLTAQQPMAVLLLALGLAGKEPGQTALAVDALVQSHLDGRLDLAALAAVLRTLLPTGLVMAKRLAKSLQAAVRADTRLSAPVFTLLCEMVAADVEQPPKDLAALMELLLELALSLPRPLPEATHTAVAALKLSGKGQVARKSLLALNPSL